MSKALDEHLLLSAHREGGLSVVMARLFNTIGPRQVGRYGMVVPRFVAAAVNDEPLLIYGDGQQTRTFCDVRDVVAALMALMADSALDGDIFNVGSADSVTIEGLADRVIKLTGRGRKAFRPFEEVFPEGFEEMRHRVPDIGRLQAAIDFHCRYSLDQTLEELIATACKAGGP